MTATFSVWRLSMSTAAALAICVATSAAQGQRDAQGQAACTENAMILFDASKSMAASADDNTGLRRIDNVRAALTRMLPRVAPKRPLGLITYGPGSRPACVNVSLEFRPKLNAAQLILSRVADLRPDGRTPLTRAVQRAAEVLDYATRSGTIVLLTDGEETCGGNSCQLAQRLKAEGAAHHRARDQLSDRERCRVGGCIGSRAASPTRRGASTRTPTRSMRSPLPSRRRSDARRSVKSRPMR